MRLMQQVVTAVRKGIPKSPYSATPGVSLFAACSQPFHVLPPALAYCSRWLCRASVAAELRTGGQGPREGTNQLLCRAGFEGGKGIVGFLFCSSGQCSFGLQRGVVWLFPAGWIWGDPPPPMEYLCSVLSAVGQEGF